MKFQVLSHAGLSVTNNNGKQLICDPWIIGSCYWRSWWNYPPVSRELVDSLNPDVIYITHIHWDHFHGPSLEKFPKDVKIVVPKGNYTRNIDDLYSLGFKNVYEIKHGETYKIDDEFEITSYQFGVFLDSAPLIECDGITLLNLNDSKHMGPTLKQIKRRHKDIDFVFRSHSSANSRMSYEIVDDPEEVVDDVERYIDEFALTARAVGAKYAVPFASNHCHLHKDSWKYNHVVQTPQMVKDHFDKNGITSPELRIMLSGDSWDAQIGFHQDTKDWFQNREELLEQYREDQSAKLQKFYETEDNTKLSLKFVQNYYKNLSKKIPFFLKRRIKDAWFTHVLYAKDKPAFVFNINVTSGQVDHLSADVNLDFETYPIQIHTTAFIFKRSIAFRIFSHMSIGKRVFYKVKKSHKPKLELLNLIYNLEEYDMIPLMSNFSKRSIETWRLRYREIILYMMLAKDKLIHGKMDFKKYLKPIS